MIDALLEALPELGPIYERDQKFSGRQFGAHVVYGDILVERFLIPLLACPTEDVATLRRIFDFLESVAATGDGYGSGVIKVTVCERLGNKKEELARARRYMGPETLKLSHEIEKFWGRE